MATNKQETVAVKETVEVILPELAMQLLAEIEKMQNYDGESLKAVPVFQNLATMEVPKFGAFLTDEEAENMRRIVTEFYAATEYTAAAALAWQEKNTPKQAVDLIDASNKFLAVPARYVGEDAHEAVRLALQQYRDEHKNLIGTAVANGAKAEKSTGRYTLQVGDVRIVLNATTDQGARKAATRQISNWRDRAGVVLCDGEPIQANG